MKKHSDRSDSRYHQPTPDYYCTWQTQLYATSDGKPEKQRAIIGEKALFEKEKPYGWAYFYEKARKDLYLVMDDSWDVPYLIADKNPNGVFSVATLGRTRDRRYWIPRCRVTAEIGGAQTIGVFGDYEALILKTVGKTPRTVLMQDLAGENAFDVT